MTHDDAIARNYRAGYYNACDGRGWQKQTEGLSVEESTRRDDDAWKYEFERSKRYTLPVARFYVGQTISTLAEYEALPVGATVWPERPDGATWWWIRTPSGYLISDQPELGETVLGGSVAARVIRSLP